MTTLTTLWLVREGGWPKACPLADPTDCNGEHCDCPLSPPVEFVQASAPCDVCDNTRLVIYRNGDHTETYLGPTPCPDCRIELVGGCPNLGGSHPVRSLGWEAHCGPVAAWGNCHLCNSGTVTLGHAYPVGQPLPIIPTPSYINPRYDITAEQWAEYAKLPMTYICVGNDGKAWLVENGRSPTGCQAMPLTAALAHYGPPARLVGKWAQQFTVVQ